MGEKREKFYTVSARLVFSSIMVLLVIGLIIGASIVINKGPVVPLMGVIGSSNSPTFRPTVGSNDSQQEQTVSPIIVEATCSTTSPTFGCKYPYFNYSNGIFTVEISQDTSYNWTSVTVMFVPANAAYSQSGVPIVSWSPPQAVNVTGGMVSNATEYVNIPISSGPVSVGTNITGSIWAKYQLNVGEQVSYANMSSAVIRIKQ